MDLYDILILSCAAIIFIIIVVLYSKSDELESNGLTINILSILIFFTMIFGFSGFLIKVKYSETQIPESSNIKNYIFENLNNEDRYLANSVKEKTFECIDKNLIKFITRNNSNSLLNKIRAKNSNIYIHQENYESIYKPCLLDYLKKSTTQKEYNEKLKIFKKSKIISDF